MGIETGIGPEIDSLCTRYLRVAGKGGAAFDAVAKAIRAYREHAYVARGLPTHSANRAALDALAKSLEDFHRQLHELPPFAAGELASASVELGYELPFAAVKVMRERLGLVITRAAHLLAANPGKAGRPSDDARDELIAALYDLFQTYRAPATRRQPHRTDDCRTFVEGILKALHLPIPSDLQERVRVAIDRKNADSSD